MSGLFNASPDWTIIYVQSVRTVSFYLYRPVNDSMWMDTEGSLSLSVWVCECVCISVYIQMLRPHLHSTRPIFLNLHLFITFLVSIHSSVAECVWKRVFFWQKKEKEKKETQVPLLVSSGKCSIYLRTKNDSKWFSIPYWYKYEIVFRKMKCFHKLFTGVYDDSRVWL